jgi:hypothetical protein
VSFLGPGNLSVAYTNRFGGYLLVGEMLFCSGYILTSSFTHTTASGDFIITGLPYTVADSSSGTFQFPTGALAFRGFTKANYTQFTVNPVNGFTYCQVFASGSGQVVDTLDTVDVPSGGTLDLRFSVFYRVANRT